MVHLEFGPKDARDAQESVPEGEQARLGEGLLRKGADALREVAARIARVQEKTRPLRRVF
jgi:hypothetical protein